MSLDSLDGATVLIAGASAGIGAAAAEQFARAGSDLVIAARRLERLEALADRLETEYDCVAMPMQADVRDEMAVDRLVEAGLDRFGGLDVSVASAGVSRGGDVAAMSTEDYRLMQETNVDGVFFLTRAALPALAESGGHLIIVGSFAGKYPRPFNPVYAATKWWVRGFAHSVLGQVGEADVGVSVINPSEVRSEFGAARGEPFYERFEPGEAVEPEEVAEAIVLAAAQTNATFSEIDINRRDKFASF